MTQIAVLGCGTVASGVIRLLQLHGESIRKQLGEEIVLRKVLARTPEKAFRLGLREDQVCSDFSVILNDPSISVVIELIGGTDDAYIFVSSALAAGKNVVTANKDLIASRYPELADLAEKHGVSLAFEASVGGGIPLIDPIRRTLAANTIQSVYGILNGTTNYILTRMTNDGMPYAEALRQAQELGYAEADPSSDVGGADAARKIAILASLAFHTTVTYDEVFHEGITDVTQTDIRFADRSGYVIKLLAAARRKDDGCEVYVRPALLSKSHPLASVSDAFNAVFINGDAVGEVMLYGRGAGSMPTASSVVGDLMSVIRERGAGETAGSARFESVPVLDVLTTEHVYYVRLSVQDRPMVLAGVAGVFGSHGVSLASLVQEERGEDAAELMLFTHRTSESRMAAAMADLRRMESVFEGTFRICLEDTK
ncbi:MAG: homoserine dehydrogenase [Clostridia bacterium]|nr:homoserine dehydrogenase [Clostridia bacterium]